MAAAPPRSSTAIIALSATYLLSSLVLSVSTSAASWSVHRGDFPPLSSIWFIVSVGVAPLVAMAVRQLPLRRCLVTAQWMIIGGVATLLLDLHRYVSQASLTLVSLGHLGIGATLLVVAWRSRRSVPGILAGVFILPNVLDRAVVTELLNFDLMFERRPLVVVALVLASLGLLSLLAARSGEFAGPDQHERSFDLATIIGAGMMLGAAASVVVRTNPYDGTAPTVVAGCVCIAGLMLIGVTKQNRRSEEPVIDIDPALLVFCGAGAVFATWVEYGSIVFSLGSSTIGRNVAIGFDNGELWSRALSIVLILTAIPLVARVVENDRRLLSTGAMALAGAGLVWTFLELADLERNLVDFLAFNLLLEWGSFVVLGAVIAFALRSTDGASIEIGLVAFLAGLPVLQQLASSTGWPLVGEGLLSSGFQDTSNLQLFTVVSAVGLVWIAAWWALRSDARY